MINSMPVKRLAFVLYIISCLPSCRGDYLDQTTLIVYSPHGKELLTEYETSFEASNPSIDVRWLDMGSQDALDRIRSERSNPQADVWFGAPSTMFSTAEKENLLTAYRPTWASSIDASARSQADFWYGTYKTPEVIAYNTNALTREEAPQDWNSLLNKKWQNKIIIRDPISSGTMRTIYAAMILQNLTVDGNPKKGYDWLSRLDANTKEYTLNSTLMLQKLGREEATVTLWNMPDIELQKTKYDFPIDYIIPSSGTPILTDAIAIVRGTKNLEAAQAYYEFVTNPENIALASKLFYRIPSRNDIEPEKLPLWIQNLDIKEMHMDWEMVEEHSQDWMEYWDSYIRGGK